jgi:peptide/nickel transport system ATP-binding protein
MTLQPTTAVRNETLLDIRNVCVDYMASNGAVHAVDNVSFTLKRGQIMGLAGESGSGKSTLAYAIARLLRPPAVITNGEILYYRDEKHAQSEARVFSLRREQKRVDHGEAIDILDLSSSQLRAFRWSELAIVFQSAMNALNPVMNVETQITDVIQAHNPSMNAAERHQRAVDLLRMVGIAPDRLRSFPHELSGGMRQRVIIAIALALDPEMIIMDEPTTALDVVVQREILELVKSLCKQFSMTMIFITHDLSLLLELADSIAIMYAGKLVEQAASIDIYQHPRHPYSYGLLNSFPTIHGPRRRMVGIPGTPPDLRVLQTGCPFTPRCPLAFDACSTVRPSLLPANATSPNQLVACHLYDPKLSQHVPSSEDLAASYEALAERSGVR